MDDSLTRYEVNEAMKPTVVSIATGSDDALEKQLITKSVQANIVKFTPKDSQQRFGSIEKLREWQAKGREIHWLIGPDDDLAGIIWYGKSDFPLDLKLDEQPQETFAIRIYDGYAGHGLARPFMTQSLSVLVQQKQAKGEAVTPIWLQTDLDNPAAVAAYTKFGYQEVHSDEKRVTMVLPTSKILAIAAS